MTLTTRSNGDTIKASFFNDIKTEVENISTTASDTFAIGGGTIDNNKPILAQKVISYGVAVADWEEFAPAWIYDAGLNLNVMHIFVIIN